MALLTFAEIDQIIINHRRAEAARNTPAAIACRALETLREALAEVSTIERAELVCELYELINDTDVVIWGHVGDVPRAREAAG